MLFWIIDEEWADYNAETEIIRKRYPDCEIRRSTYDYLKDLEEFGYKCDAILTQIYTKIPASTIDRLESCKAICVYGGGYDRVDTVRAREKGITVTNVQGYCAEDLADYVLAAIFLKNKPLEKWSAQISSGVWGAPAVTSPHKRISSSTLFIVGCGRIGATVARRASALGMRVIGYDPTMTEEQFAEKGIEHVEWADGFAQADFVSVNAKYQPSTHHLIGMNEFRLMKPSAVLINTSRGNVINEDEMIAAVESKIISGAVVDVISEEPPHGTEKILSCENIIVTPHISYISQESFAELKRRTAENAICILDGGTPSDKVN